MVSCSTFSLLVYFNKREDIRLGYFICFIVGSIVPGLNLVVLLATCTIMLDEDVGPVIIPGSRKAGRR